jgi:Ser/Thr protein kinase RdoA (MazF antagonist)
MSAQEAARLWGSTGSPRLIKDRENAVYEIALPNGDRAALRLHRPGYQSAAAIRSELWWMARLAEAGVPVPRPVLTRGGALVAEVGGRAASVVSWVEGEQIGDGATPLEDDAAAVTSRYRALGALIAAMHDETDGLALPPDFERLSWNRVAYTGEEPLWGRFWENPSLSPDEAALLRAARAEADAALARHETDGADFGLIHADVLRENVLTHEGRLSLIDFDDSGFGFRAYDLATAEVQGLEDPMNAAASLALHEGYRAARRADAPPLGDVTLFVALRTFASCGWIVTRAAPDDPRQRFYADRAVRAAQRLLRL